MRLWALLLVLLLGVVSPARAQPAPPVSSESGCDGATSEWVLSTGLSGGVAFGLALLTSHLHVPRAPEAQMTLTFGATALVAPLGTALLTHWLSGAEAEPSRAEVYLWSASARLGLLAVGLGADLVGTGRVGSTTLGMGLIGIVLGSGIEVLAANGGHAPRADRPFALALGVEGLATPTLLWGMRPQAGAGLSLSLGPQFGRWGTLAVRLRAGVLPFPLENPTSRDTAPFIGLGLVYRTPIAPDRIVTPYAQLSTGAISNGSTLVEAGVEGGLAVAVSAEHAITFGLQANAIGANALRAFPGFALGLLRQ